MALTAAERETIITISDADDFWHIQTSQRPVITKLLKNSTATILSDRNFDGSRMVTATIPKNGITVRGTAKATRSTSKRSMPSTVKCKGVKADGKKCGSIMKGDTGYCVKHQDQAKK